MSTNTNCCNIMQDHHHNKTLVSRVWDNLYSRYMSDTTIDQADIIKKQQEAERERYNHRNNDIHRMIMRYV